MKKVFLALSIVAASLTANAQWTVDAVHSSVRFSIEHMLVSEAEGSFKKFDGTVTSSKDDFSDLNTTFTIQAGSVFTDNEKRDEHVKSADFFDVAKYPTITFTSSSFKKVAEKKYELTGKLDFHGVSKEVKWEVKASGIVKDPYGNNRAGFKATTKIKRGDFNLATSTPAAVLGEEVEITVNLEILKK